jgi:sulfate permease, SulP family
MVLGPEGFSALGLEQSLWRLWPALAMVTLLFAAQVMFGGAGSVIIVTGLCLAAFYLWLWSQGLGQAEAVALHLLPDIPAESPIFALPDLSIIDWSAVALAAPTLAAVVMLNLIGLLLNTAGVELANSDAVDINAELQVSGKANLLIGLFGGLTSYLQGGASIIANKLGVERRAFIFGHVAVVLLAAAFAGPMVAVVPVFIAAALLVYIGTAMLWDWLIATFNQLVTQDWLIVLGIVALTVFFGILPAVIAGLVLAALSFAISYARLPVVRQITNIAQHPSVLDRSASARALLLRQGHRVPVLYLQGALFFGSVEQLTKHLIELEKATQGMQSVVLDFSGSRTFDSSACAAMVRLGRLFEAKGMTIWLAGMAPELKTVIARWGLLVPETGRADGLRQVDTLDQALEIAEDDLLEEFGIGVEDIGLEVLMQPLCDNHPRLPDLIALMQRQELQTGDVLIRASDPSRDVFFIESGRLGVFIPNRDIQHRRVRSAGPGGVIGEMAYLTALPRGADVEAEAPTVVFRLAEATIDALRRDDPDLATLLAFILGRSVAVKLTQTNALMMAGK